MTIETWRIVQFRRMIHHNLQEKGGKLRPFVNVGTGYTGKTVSPVDYLSPAVAQKVNQRFGDNPMNTLNHTRRHVVPTTWDWGTPVDQVDKLLTGIAPEGDYTKAGVEAIRRAEDTEILQAFWGAAKTGEQGETTESWSDTGLIVDKSVGGANTGLNQAKLRKLRSIFTKMHVDLDAEAPVIAITEEDVDSLFGENANISIDFVDGKPVSTGKLPQLFGFRFVVFSSVTLDALGFKTSTTRDLPVWVPSGIHLGIWKDQESDIWRLSGKKNIPYVYCAQTLGATRLERGRVLKCQVHSA